jgi:hypothetical protein
VPATHEACVVATRSGMEDVNRHRSRCRHRDRGHREAARSQATHCRTDLRRHRPMQTEHTAPSKSVPAIPRAHGQDILTARVASPLKHPHRHPLHTSLRAASLCCSLARMDPDQREADATMIAVRSRAHRNKGCPGAHNRRRPVYDARYQSWHQHLVPRARCRVEGRDQEALTHAQTPEP